MPTSVLFGLALLPFMIPLVWLLVPRITGLEPILSLAAPIALAVTGATLTLSVVSTVDWTPATRIKGVVMIVGLAYFCGATLFFLKQNAVDWVKQNFGQDESWHEFRAGNRFAVRLPGDVNRFNEPPVQGWNLDSCFRSKVGDLGEMFTYTVGVNTKPQLNPLPRADWFTQVKKGIEHNAGVEAREERSEPYNAKHPGREWTLSFPNAGTTRIVRVYQVDARLCYLAVEGPNISVDDENVQTFLNSFRLVDVPR